MGTRFTVGGVELQVLDYTVTEESTGIAVTDSSGGVGSVSVTVAKPDPLFFSRRSFNANQLAFRGVPASVLRGEKFELEDPEYGRIPGFIDSVSSQETTLEFTGYPVLGQLNVDNASIPPFYGTVQDAIAHFLTAASVTSEELPYFVDPALRSRVVSLGRAEGELWFYLKQFAASLEAEISLVDGTLILRPIRGYVTEPERWLARSGGDSRSGVSKGVIFHTEIRSEPFSGPTRVYPGVGDLNSQLPVASVPGGESGTFEIDLRSEILESESDPEGFSFGESAIRVYDDQNTKVGEFLPGYWTRETPDAYEFQRIRILNGWYAKRLGISSGGFASGFQLSIDKFPRFPRTLSLTFSAPSIDSRTFSLARISGGKIVNGVFVFATWGMRVALGEAGPFHTGASSLELEQDSFDEFSSPVVDWKGSNTSRLGFLSAYLRSGNVRTLSATVDRVRPPRESGYFKSVPYEYVADELGARSYSQVLGYYSPSAPEVTYRSVQNVWDLVRENSVKTWVFGNVAGSRVWDPESNSFYRIRSASISPGGVQFSAESDNTLSDVAGGFTQEGLTYAGVDDRLSSYGEINYRQATAAGYLKESYDGQ